MYIDVHDLEPLNLYLDHRFLGSGGRPRWKSSMKELFLTLKMKTGQGGRGHSSAEVAAIHKCPDICVFSLTLPVSE